MEIWCLGLPVGSRLHLLEGCFVGDPASPAVRLLFAVPPGAAISHPPSAGQQHFQLQAGAIRAMPDVGDLS